MGSRTCPNLTKLGMEYPWVSRVYNKKNFCYSLPRKKVRISIGNIDLSAYSIFKNIEILSDQGVVQSEPN